MLSTQSRLQARLQSVPSVNPDRAFERYVLTNPEICSECFAQIKEITEEQASKWGATVDRHDRVDAGVKGYDDIDGAWRPRTFCEECGGRGWVHSETLSKRQALDRVDRLADRLAEEGIPVNVDVLRHAVSQLKSDDRVEAYDREIWERAVKLAIQHAHS